MPERLQQRGLVVDGEGTPELFFAVGRLGAEVVAELADDVVLAPGREVVADGVQVAIDQVHGSQSWRIRVIEVLMARHSASSSATMRVPSAREAVEALLALVFLAPLAGEQALALEPAEERVEGAFVDGEALVGECLPERVAVVLVPELDEHGQHQAAPAELQPEVLEVVGVLGWGVGVSHVCAAQCMTHTV